MLQQADPAAARVEGAQEIAPNPPAVDPAHPAALPAAEGAEAITGHETAGGTTAVAAHGGEGGGLPQFRFEYWGGQIIFLLLIFAVLYALMATVFTPRLRRIFDTRKQTIDEALAEARRTQAEADSQAAAAKAAVEQARAEAQRVASDAKAKSRAEADAREKAEQAKLDERLAKAEAEIRASREQAMGNVRTVAADTAAAIVEKLTGQAANQADIDAALNRAA